VRGGEGVEKGKDEGACPQPSLSLALSLNVLYHRSVLARGVQKEGGE